MAVAATVRQIRQMRRHTGRCTSLVRSGASLLCANRRASGSGDEKPEIRYFKPFRGIVLREEMKRHYIKIDVLIEE